MSFKEFISSMSPIFKYFSNITDSLNEAYQGVADVLDNLLPFLKDSFFTGNLFPDWLVLGATVTVSIFLIRFLLFK